jgi:hypothetical protein
LIVEGALQILCDNLNHRKITKITNSLTNIENKRPEILKKEKSNSIDALTSEQKNQQIKGIAKTNS